MWYTFVVRTNSNSSYTVFEQTQTRLIFKGSFYLFYGKISKSSKETFSSYFFTNLESDISLQGLYLKWMKYHGLGYQLVIHWESFAL